VRQRHEQLFGGAASHESRSPRLLARASIVEARRLGGGSRGSLAQWRQPRRGGSVLEASEVDWTRWEMRRGGGNTRRRL
jgi:hypothetical protein